MTGTSTTMLRRVPLSALTRFESRYGPEFKMRYNEYSAAQIVGSAAPGYSSEQATTALEEVFHQTMPPEMGFDYMGMSRQEQKAREGLPSWAIFGMSLVFVFLILAALYESWTLPVSVLVAVLVALGDQPAITAELVNAMLRAFATSGKGIVVPMHAGERGHPLLFARRYCEEVLIDYDAVGLRGVLMAHPEDVLEFDVPSSAVLSDMDSPDDYRRELTRRGKERY